MSSTSSQVMSRFCDYFVVCGLDDGAGLEVQATVDVDGTRELPTCAPLERSYKPKILAHYPESVPWNPFDPDAVRNLCLPDGLLFRTQKQNLTTAFHPFVITKEDGSRTHGFSLVFFEPLRSSHVTQAILTLQAMHLTELSSAKNYHRQRSAQSRKMRSAKGRLAPHLLPDHQRGGGADTDPSCDEPNTRSLPRHFKLAAHKQPGSLLSQSFYDASKDTLYVSKAIALICPLPFVQAPHTFLLALHRRAILSATSSASDPSLEAAIYHFLYHVPLPPPGRSLRLETLWGESLTCLNPSAVNRLPLCDYFMGDLFRLLDLDSFLQLFTCVLLENQVLLYSRDLYRLMLVAETVTALLFPFAWQHVYVPILPSTLHHFLDAPVPFIMGLHASDSSTPQQLPSCEANLCFVDIDRNKVGVPEDLPAFPHRHELVLELAQVLRQHGIPLGNLNKSNSVSNMPTPTAAAGSPFHTRRARPRKNSWSHDSDSGMSSNEESCISGGSTLNLSMSASYHPAYTLRPPKYPNRRESPSQIEIVTPSPLLPVGGGTPWVGGVVGGAGEEGGLDAVYLKNLKINSAIREIFANRFVHMFASYDHFLSQPNEDSGRHFVHNFDKATFLSDQPDQNLPFLSSFIETQMFASLIDRKIAALGGDSDLEANLVVFEGRIKVLRDQFGESLVRTPSYEPCVSIKESVKELGVQFQRPDFIAPPIREILPDTMAVYGDSFPVLNGRYLNCGPKDTRNLKLLRREMSIATNTTNNVTSTESASDPSNPSLRSVFQPKQSTSSPSSVAQANWEFVKQLLQTPHVISSNFHTRLGQELLKECKTKTKRMLVEKMGSEAVALGHGEVTLLGVEENTLVASLCDLLERMWAHGLHVKGKGRSPLWNYLTNFHESEACKDSSKPIDPQLLTPDLSAMASELNLNATSTPTTPPATTTTTPTSPQRRRPMVRGGGGSTVGQLPVLHPLPVSIAFDMQNVQSISEIKTEIGYARAWVRLSLEKKVLSKHLRGLLADDELLRGFYKRTAFLRSEDEREQFLYHLLTLNAADYYCFTNSYLNIVLPYRVLIFPLKRFNISSTSANVWISVSGTLGETPNLQLPKNSLEFVFQAKNLGLLTNMHIGHDNSGVSPKWLVEYVLIRNEVTGHLVKFPCGRWLGREVDDGSTERLLVGEQFYESGGGGGGVGGSGNGDELVAQTPPPRARSPSVPRRDDNLRNPVEIQECLGNAVNSIVKYFFKTDRERGRNLTVLLCGEAGLVAALEQVFSFGFKSNRLFGRNIHLWDYFVQVGEVFAGRLQEEEDEEDDNTAEMSCYCTLVRKINAHANTLGKHGRFQLLICLCAREHLLPRLPPLLSRLQITRSMYEDVSFLRAPELLGDLIQVLLALDDYDIVLEQSLSKGIE
ncbi:DENN domain-containing protein 5B isoform X2 [Folsomia candida]|uniref:DENN domain-containing protein 5B isoform X2 n=1 Tax=Folsomia candida TaxID=158441 RepID=UPI000B8F66DF|nr:DENN domain-containing protein 5B isoform X2 [Folsomia candida]